MSKENDIRTAVNFLASIYGNNGSWNVAALASIYTAQAEGNTKVISDALRDIGRFCESLAKNLEND